MSTEIRRGLALGVLFAPSPVLDGSLRLTYFMQKACCDNATLGTTRLRTTLRNHYRDMQL